MQAHGNCQTDTEPLDLFCGYVAQGPALDRDTLRGDEKGTTGPVQPSVVIVDPEDVVRIIMFRHTADSKNVVLSICESSLGFTIASVTIASDMVGVGTSISTGYISDLSP